MTTIEKSEDIMLKSGCCIERKRLPNLEIWMEKRGSDTVTEGKH